MKWYNGNCKKDPDSRLVSVVNDAQIPGAVRAKIKPHPPTIYLDGAAHVETFVSHTLHLRFD
ncbi:MAG: hypothetical protein JWM11_3738, partial [Planctomycetaceae bacterium]|nr:hypothetical protein [Planctomycetaceae bacterium]